MAYQFQGVDLNRDDKPTFSGVYVVGEWVENDTDEFQEVLNGSGQLINVNKADATNLEVNTQVVSTSGVSEGDTLTETNGALRIWVVMKASEVKDPNVKAQDVRLRNSAQVQAEI